jgi:hypothetical protein
LEWHGDQVEDLFDCGGYNTDNHSNDNLNSDRNINNCDNDDDCNNNGNCNDNRGNNDDYNNDNEQITNDNDNHNNNHNNADSTDTNDKIQQVCFDYTPIVLLSVSPPITDAYHNEIHSWTYIQGE